MVEPGMQPEFDAPECSGSCPQIFPEAVVVVPLCAPTPQASFLLDFLSSTEEQILHGSRVT